MILREELAFGKLKGCGTCIWFIRQIYGQQWPPISLTYEMREREQCMSKLPTRHLTVYSDHKHFEE